MTSWGLTAVRILRGGWRVEASMAMVPGALTLALLLGLAACGRGPGGPATPPPSDAGSFEADAPGARSDERLPRVVALGDSLTAGYGLPEDQAYPAVLQRLVDAAGYRYNVANMGVSGDTSAGGLRRADWALEGDVRVLIVALGANDGLRGLSPADLEANLRQIADRARARGAAVVLCGMEAPPNFGAAYTSAFRQVYPRVARETGATLVPFLLAGVAGRPELNQADGIHPNARGAELMARLVWARLQPLLDDLDP